MPELVFKDLNDLKKLAGWTIEKAGIIQKGVPPILGIVISHPAAEKKVLLKLWPIVRLGRSGNVVTCSEDLSIQSNDYEEAPKEGEEL